MISAKLKRSFMAVLALMMLVASFVASVPVLAQTANSGVITGVVKDPQGGVVPNATVRAVNIGTNAAREATTGGDGTYEISQLTPGAYRVEVESQGFAKFTQDQVTVSVLSRVTVDPTLGVAGTSEQVNVAGESAPLIETTKTDVGGVLDQRRVENLPVNGRSFASLAVVLPNVTQAPSFDPTKARTGSFSVEGGTGRNVNITVDGGDNKDNVVGGILQNFSLEGIQEFAISTQRFSAANGRSAGALLSIVSKSGTNQLHGTAFGFFRDDKLNSNAPKLLAEANPSKFPNAGDAIKLPFTASSSAVQSEARSRQTKPSSSVPSSAHAKKATRSSAAPTSPKSSVSKRSIWDTRRRVLSRNRSAMRSTLSRLISTRRPRTLSP